MSQNEMTKVLDGKVVLVTGATAGIGKEVAKHYALHGATVVLLGRNKRLLNVVYDEILAQGSLEPVAVELDLFEMSDDDASALANQIYQVLGRLDGIVHCASYFYATSPLVDQRMSEWMNQYKVNTVAPFTITRACLPLLKKSADASVIMVGETHGVHAGPFWGAFGSSKAGLTYLTQVMASEWDVYPNLRVNMFVPGSVNSPLRMRTHPGEAKSERAEISDLLPSFLHLMSKSSAHQSGEIIEFKRNND